MLSREFSEKTKLDRLQRREDKKTKIHHFPSLISGALMHAIYNHIFEMNASSLTGGVFPYMDSLRSDV